MMPTTTSSKNLNLIIPGPQKKDLKPRTRKLRHSGHNVRVAYSGGAGLRAAQEFRTQAMLLDLGLPEMDGFEIARRIRRDPALAPMRLIAVSGYGQDADRKRSQEAGFDTHLVKPVNPQQIEQILSTLAK